MDLGVAMNKHERFKGLLHFMVGVGLLIGIILLYTVHGRNNSLVSEVKLEKNKQLAVWEWRNIPEINNYNEKLKNAASNGIDKVFLNVNSITDIENEPTLTRNTDLHEYISQLQSYVTTASSYRISVDALAGDKDWATPAQQFLMPEVVKFVSNYNQQSSQNAQFAGLQFDVEAYNLPAYQVNQQTVMTNYLNAIKNVTINWQQTENLAHLALGFTVPLWLDGDNNYAQKVSFGGQDNYPTFLLMNTISALMKPYIVVMDYRNHAIGPNGSIFHAQGEIKYAQTNYPHLGVLLGQELSDVEPSSITFFNKSRDDLTKQLKQLKQSFDKYSVFKGFVFNSFKSYEPYINKS